MNITNITLSASSQKRELKHLWPVSSNTGKSDRNQNSLCLQCGDYYERERESLLGGAGNILLDLVGGLVGAFTGKIVLS